MGFSLQREGGTQAAEEKLLDVSCIQLCLAYRVEPDHSRSCRLDPDLLSSSFGEVDFPVAVEWTAVVDAHDHLISGCGVRDSNQAAERQGSVGGGHQLRVEGLSACRWTARKLITVIARFNRCGGSIDRAHIPFRSLRDGHTRIRCAVGGQRRGRSARRLHSGETEKRGCGSRCHQPGAKVPATWFEAPNPAHPSLRTRFHGRAWAAKINWMRVHDIESMHPEECSSTGNVLHLSLANTVQSIL